jgi:hypothetical protein
MSCKQESADSSTPPPVAQVTVAAAGGGGSTCCADEAPTLCDHGWMHVTFDESTDVLWIGVRHCPTSVDIDNMWLTVSTFVRNYPNELTIHIEHIVTTDLNALPYKTMLHILTVLAGHKLRIKCILFQPKKIDDKVNMATNIFRALTPDLELNVCEGKASAQKVIASLARRIK